MEKEEVKFSQIILTQKEVEGVLESLVQMPMIYSEGLVAFIRSKAQEAAKNEAAPAPPAGEAVMKKS
jgi:hypothetical protein